MARGKKKETILTREERLQQALVPEVEWPYKVPENWRWTRLSYLLSTSKEKTEDFSDKEVKYIGLENIEKDYGIVSYNSSEGIKSQKSVFLEGQILYGKLRPYLNKHDIAPFSGICSTDILVFDTKETTSNQFVNYFLSLQSFIEYAVANSKGINLPRVSESVVLEALCPLPPLPEQQRIVDRIESLFGKLDEAKEKAQAVVDGAKERKASLLFQAFTGNLTEQWRAQNEGKYSIDDWLEYKNDVVGQSECPTDLPNSWRWIRMGAVGYTNIGLTYSPSDKSDDGIIVLRSSNIQNGKMDYEDIVRVNMSIPENKMCRKGDLLICARNGSKALVGKTAIVDADGMSYGAFMAIFRSIYNPYIYFFLSSPFFRDLIDKDVGTTTINQVTQAIIKNLPLPFAPKEEQSEVVRILSGLLGKEDIIIETATSVIDQIEGIKKSILARAFRGELGTNDPSDESAEELLKRIL